MQRYGEAAERLSAELEEARAAATSTEEQARHGALNPPTAFIEITISAVGFTSHTSKRAPSAAGGPGEGRMEH